jgi:signal transduction histidine kinase
MKTFDPAEAYRGGYWIGWIVVAVVVLLLLLYAPPATMITRQLPILGIFALLYLASPLLLARVAWFRLFYFPFQACLVFALGLLAIDGTNLLYFPLSLQAPHAFGRKAALGWMWIYSSLLALTLFISQPFGDALALLLIFLAVGSFLVSYDFLYTQTRHDQAESRRLLEDLQAAHARLQEHAARAEELAAMQARNQLARELHDSVSQMVFSIRFTAQAAQLALQSDAACLPEQLDRLQEMTTSALAQLRSLIAELHPR